MCKAHDALTIVFLLHKGKLESFEQDNRGRLLLADLIGRRAGRGDEILEVSWKTTLRPAIEKLRKLVPEYVAEDLRKGPLNSKRWSGHVLDAFKETILDKLRESTFGRLGQAQGYITRYYDTIRDAYPVWRKPTTSYMHTISYLHLPDLEHPMPFKPIRLELVKRVQRLVPEVGFATTEITDENSSRILEEITMVLNGRAKDQLNHYGDIHEKRNRERLIEDRREGLADESDDSAESYDTDAPDDDADPETWNVYWRSLARPWG